RQQATPNSRAFRSVSRPVLRKKDIINIGSARLSQSDSVMGIASLLLQQVHGPAAAVVPPGAEDCPEQLPSATPHRPTSLVSGPRPPAACPTTAPGKATAPPAHP